ncbi:MAG: TRAP transporter small permease [Thermodesulfobacteriota bacterium]
MGRLFSITEKLSQGFAVFSISCMIIVVLGSTLSRYLLSFAFPWGEELARYLMVALVYLTAGVVLKRNGHISVLYFRDKLPSGLRRWVIMACYALLLAFSALISWEGYKLIAMLMSQTSPAMGIPMGIAYASVPVGSLLISIQAFGLLWREWHR